MSKSRIRREELIEKVLAAARAEPGCDGVQEVGISEVEILGEGSCWRVTVIDAGEVKQDLASHAAQRVEGRLNERYELNYSKGRNCT